jgi:hypothetical protein
MTQAVPRSQRLRMAAEFDFKQQVRELINERGRHIDRIRELQAENARLRLDLAHYAKGAGEA